MLAPIRLGNQQCVGLFVFVRIYGLALLMVGVVRGEPGSHGGRSAARGYSLLGLCAATIDQQRLESMDLI
jgi:hypothetical protein